MRAIVDCHQSLAPLVQTKVGVRQQRNDVANCLSDKGENSVDRAQFFFFTRTENAVHPTDRTFHKFSHRPIGNFQLIDLPVASTSRLARERVLDFAVT